VKSFRSNFGVISDVSLTSPQPDEALLSGNDLLFISGSDPTYAGTLFGYGGNDLLIGGAGNDYLFGGIGNDHLFGRGGDDNFLADAGNDFINGGTGTDTLLFYSIQAPVTVDLSKGNAFSIETGHDKLISIENVIGGDGNDTITGNSKANEIMGGLGDDTIRGGGGDDLILGGPGNDVVYGGNGNDTIYGDGGNDILTGGAGNDVFIFYGAEFKMQEVITDFHHGDKIDLSQETDPANMVGSIADLLSNHAHQIGTNAVLDLPYEMTLTLKNVQLSHLTADDFII
jgi:Ca2+-binding RTX toxin-like protein